MRLMLPSRSACGSVAAAIMFQPLAMEAQLTGYSTVYRFLDGKPLPPVEKRKTFLDWLID